ncbi:FxLYD domain-containing protein [Streptomyces sp. NPDC000983]|uniref:FxLYD domain-containing protein n=1 Tax=Streptomyces sp. NPDC000983 TaxID=3154373 RepID=UPI003332959A
MAGDRSRRARGVAVPAALLALALGGLVGCSEDDLPEGVSSRAASAASALASEAEKQLDGIKDGVDAKDEVRLGDTGTDGGKVTVPVTVENTDDSTKSFGVQVDFTDSDGNRLDTVVVTVSDVAGGESKEATARSNRDLSGDNVRAEVARAVRY